MVRQCTDAAKVVVNIAALKPLNALAFNGPSHPLFSAGGPACLAGAEGHNSPHGPSPQPFEAAGR